MVTRDGHSQARARDSFLDGSLVLNFSKRRDSSRSGCCCDSRFWLLSHGAFHARDSAVTRALWPKLRNAADHLIAKIQFVIPIASPAYLIRVGMSPQSGNNHEH